MVLPMTYRALDPDRIVATLEALVRRIDDRFPDAGLRQVCRELIAIARDGAAPPGAA